jgi:hypothetical protein
MPAATLGAVFPHKKGREGLEEAVSHLYEKIASLERAKSTKEGYRPVDREYKATQDRR